jgi:hypothetical protein
VIDRLPQLGTAGFELLLPSGRGRRFASGLGLLSGWLLGESTTFQLGLGLGSGLPGESSNGGQFLVVGGDGSELLVFGGDLAGQRMRVRGLGVVVPGAASAACRQASASAWAVSRS